MKKQNLNEEQKIQASNILISLVNGQSGFVQITHLKDDGTEIGKTNLGFLQCTNPSPEEIYLIDTYKEPLGFKLETNFFIENVIKINIKENSFTIETPERIDGVLKISKCDLKASEAEKKILEGK